jgi:hypothetical protein
MTDAELVSGSSCERRSCPSDVTARPLTTERTRSNSRALRAPGCMDETFVAGLT